MKIAVDCDDVLAQTGVEYIRYHNEKYNTKLRENQFYDRDCLAPYGIDRKEASKRVLEYVEENILDLAPLDGAREVLEQLKKEHELVVMTGRPKYMMDKTKQWIDVHYPNIFVELVSTNMHQTNGGKDKGEWCRDLEVELMIEDYLRYATECVDVGIKVLLMAQPWNVDEEMKSDLLVRVKDWREVISTINSISS